MRFNKYIYIIELGLVLLILFSSLSLAFSVSAPYMENNQFKLFPGAETDIKFVLQNGGASEDTFAKASVIAGSEVVRIIDRNPDYYKISAGDRATVNLRVKIPETDELGKTYKVVINFETISENTGGFSFGTGIEQDFEILVGEEFLLEEPEDISFLSLYWIYIVIAIIIIIIIVFFIIRKKTKSK